MTETTEAATPRDNQTDETLQIAGETITVHGFRYAESLQLGALARPLLAAMRVMFSATDQEIEPEALDALIAEHSDIWLQMVARSCDRDVAWITALPDQEAMKLQLAFWGVNGGFFTRRLVFGAAFVAAAKRRRAPSAPPAPDSAAPA